MENTPFLKTGIQDLKITDNMENKKIGLKIETVTVNIKVLTIDHKRMTLSVFNQIQVGKPFSYEFELRGDVIGYVVNKGVKWILWNIEGELRKTKMERIDWPEDLSVFSFNILEDCLSEIIDVYHNIHGLIIYSCIYEAQRRSPDDLKQEEKDMIIEYFKKVVSRWNFLCNELIDSKNQLYISI